jgi:ferredoxin, 2Fe-2S
MKLKFIPQNVEVEVTSDKSVLQIAQENNLHIKSVCKGVPSCAECRVYVAEGEHNLAPPSSTEMSLIGTGYFIDRRRLSCQMHCFGDVTVDLSEQNEKSEKVQGTKRPSGVAKNEYNPGESRAVMGNIIHEEPKPSKVEQNRFDQAEKKANKRLFEEEKQRLLKMLRDQRKEREDAKKAGQKP